MQIRLIVLLAGWLVGWWLFWAVPRLRSAPGLRPEPSEDFVGSDDEVDGSDDVVDVAVVIPARNEGRSLPTLLSSLAVQTVRPRQVLVVDDQSTDDTAIVAAQHECVTVIAGAPLPPGWTGKSWACHQASRVARAGTLAFVDADVTFASDGLASALAEHERRGGVVSVQPFHRMERAYERCSALFNIIGFMGIGAATPWRRGRSHGAFGPVLICSAADYERVGGHSSIRSEVVEDMALARRFEAAALPVTTLGGGSLVSFRMYPDGLGQLVEGWSKNMATGARSIRWQRLVLSIAWVAAVLMSVQIVIEAGWAASVGNDGALTIALGCYVLFVVQIWSMLRQVGNFGPIAALLYPALALVFLVVFVRSAWLTIVRRRVEWRGRSIPTSRARRRHHPGDALEGAGESGR